MLVPPCGVWSGPRLTPSDVRRCVASSFVAFHQAGANRRSTFDASTRSWASRTLRGSMSTRVQQREWLGERGSAENTLVAMQASKRSGNNGSGEAQLNNNLDAIKVASGTAFATCAQTLNLVHPSVPSKLKAPKKGVVEKSEEARSSALLLKAQRR